MNIYQGQLEEHLKKEEHGRRSSLDGQTMETAKRDNRHHRHHNSGKGNRDQSSSGKGHHPSHRRAEAESLDEHTFPNSSMSMAERDTKIRTTTFPQQVPWANTNEARQEGRNLGVKGVVDMEEKSLKDVNVVSSRGQDVGALPVGNGAANLNTQDHHNDGRSRGTTNSSRQSRHMDGRAHGATSSSNPGHHNGEHDPRSTNSRRQSHHMDERAPGAFVVPGLDEDNSRGSEDRRNEFHANATHALTARVVDPDEEHRVLREQLHQVLREERAHEHVAVIHAAAINGGVEHGNSAVVNTAANSSDGDVERGTATVRQAPVININSNVQQAPTINMDSSRSGGFWHGTRGRLLMLALILVIVAAAVAVTLVLVLGEETPAPNQLNSTTEPPLVPESTPTPGANGVCGNAENIAVDGMVIVGSNVNGADVSACDTDDNGPDYYGPGAWYRFIGNGRRLTVSTCNEKTIDFPTVLSVLSSMDGTCGDDMTCEGNANGADIPYYSGCPTPDTGSTVWFDSVANKVYYASVIGYDRAVGDFGLTIFDDSVGCDADKVPQPVNGVVTVGSNVNGTYVSACTDYYGPGAWYRFIGNGRRLTVSTCNEKTTDFATVLSVLSSTDGTCSDDKLTCEDTASGADIPYYSGCPTPDTGSMVNIDSVVDKVYYASVTGYEGAVGNFGLSIFDDTPARRRARTLHGMPWSRLL